MQRQGKFMDYVGYPSKLKYEIDSSTGSEDVAGSLKACGQVWRFEIVPRDGGDAIRRGVIFLMGEGVLEFETTFS